MGLIPERTSLVIHYVLSIIPSTTSFSFPVVVLLSEVKGSYCSQPPLALFSPIVFGGGVVSSTCSALALDLINPPLISFHLYHSSDIHGQWTCAHRRKRISCKAEIQ